MKGIRRERSLTAYSVDQTIADQVILDLRAADFRVEGEGDSHFIFERDSAAVIGYIGPLQTVPAFTKITLEIYDSKFGSSLPSSRLKEFIETSIEG